MTTRRRYCVPFLLALTVSTAPLASQWQQASPATAPGSLTSPAMAASSNGSVVMFGGDRGVFPSPFSGDTWVYGGDWTLVPTTGGPSPRYEARMVFDSLRNLWVMYGGWNSPFSIGSGLDETWEFNGAAWTQVFTTASPGGLWKHAMCFDPVRNVTVLVSGAPTGLPGAVNQTWEYNGTNWTQVTTVGTPGPRENAAMCFDANIGRCVLFGGSDPFSGATNQLWLYNGVTWQQVGQVGAWPSARAAMEMVYDSSRNVCLMHGGVDNIGNALSDTWEFSSLTLAWTQRSTPGPSGHNFGLAFDPVSNRALRYGGFGNPGQTWQYGAGDRSIGSGCAGSNGVPALTALGAPRIGQAYTLQLANLNPSIPVTVLVLSLTGTAPTPLAIIGMPGCDAFLTPDVLLSFATSAGFAQWNGSIPNNAGLLGVALFSQGLSLDPGVNAAGLTVSNAREGLVGF